MLDICSGGPQLIGDVRGDVVRMGVGFIVGVERSVGRGPVAVEMEGMMLAGMDGAEDWVPRHPVSEECFPMGCVLLVCVGEGDVYPCLHIIQGTLHGRSMLTSSSEPKASHWIGGTCAKACLVESKS